MEGQGSISNSLGLAAVATSGNAEIKFFVIKGRRDPRLPPFQVVTIRSFLMMVTMLFPLSKL